MRSRRRSNNAGPYVIVGGAALLIVAIAVLIFALRGRIGALFAHERGPASENTPSDPPERKRRRGDSEFPPVVVKSDDLRQKYVDNEGEADGMYKDRLVEITGTITIVLYENSTGIVFGTERDMMPPVLCDLNAKLGDLRSQLRPGQTVTVRGTGVGKVQGGFIGFLNCRLVSPGGADGHRDKKP